MIGIELPHEPNALVRDRIRGALWGQALGDAMGLSTEFMDRTTADLAYGNQPFRFDNCIQDRHRSRWVRTDHTDDTDQAVSFFPALHVFSPSL